MPGQWSLSHCIHDGMSWFLEKTGSKPLKLWALRSLTVSSGMGKLERILSSPWVFPFLSHYYFLPQEHPWSWSLVRNGRGHSWAWALLSLVSLTSFPFFSLGLGMSASASETSWFLSLFYFFPIGCFLLKGLLFFWDVLLLQALWSWGSSSFLALLDLAEHTSTSEGPFSFTAFALEEQVFSIPFVASSVFDFGFSFLLFLLLALAASPLSENRGVVVIKVLQHRQENKRWLCDAGVYAERCLAMKQHESKVHSRFFPRPHHLSSSCWTLEISTSRWTLGVQLQLVWEQQASQWISLWWLQVEKSDPFICTSCNMGSEEVECFLPRYMHTGTRLTCCHVCQGKGVCASACLGRQCFW